MLLASLLLDQGFVINNDVKVGYSFSEMTCNYCKAMCERVRMISAHVANLGGLWVIFNV